MSRARLQTTWAILLFPSSKRNFRRCLLGTHACVSFSSLCAKRDPGWPSTRFSDNCKHSVWTPLLALSAIKPAPPLPSRRQWPFLPASHAPLSLQLLFILSRSICIIFKFKYTVRGRSCRLTFFPNLSVLSLPSPCRLAHPLSTARPRCLLINYLSQCSVNMSCRSSDSNSLSGGHENKVEVDTFT